MVSGPMTTLPRREGEAANGDPVDAAGGRAAVRVVDGAVARIDRGVVDAAQQRVHARELRPRLRAVGGRDDDARRVAVQRPGVPPIGRAVQHVVDRLGTVEQATGPDAALEERIHRPGGRVLGHAQPRIDSAGGVADLLVDGEVERHHPVGHRHVHVRPVDAVAVREIIPGRIDVVLAGERRVAVGERPRLVGIEEAARDEVVRQLGGASLDAISSRRSGRSHCW